MAKKRLNKKLVVILALTGIPLLLVLAIALDSRKPYLPAPVHNTLLKLLNRDPHELVNQTNGLVEMIEKTQKEIDAKVALEKDPKKAYTLRLDMEESQLIPLWDDAFQKIKKAYGMARDDEALKTDVLVQQAALRVQAARVGDQKWREEQYRNLLAIWKEQFNRAPTDYNVKKSLVDFYYTQAKADSFSWSEIKPHAEKLIEIDPDNPYGYMVYGHCDLSLVDTGLVDPTHSKAREFLEKALQRDEKDVDVLCLMARLCQQEAQTINDAAEKLRLEKASEDCLRQAVSYHPDSAEAHLNLLDHHLIRQVQNAYAAAAVPQRETIRLSQEASNAELEAERLNDQASSTQDVTEKKRLEMKAQYKTDDFNRLTSESASQNKQAEQRLKLAGEAKAKVMATLDGWIAERFSKNARFYDRKASLYSLQIIHPNMASTTQIIALYEKAIGCEPGKAEYQGKQAQYYLMRSAYSISPQADLEKAYHLLRRIQYHSDAAIPTGVDRPALMGIRFNHILEPLIRVCTELAKGSEDSQAAAAYLAEANAAYKDVELEFDRNNPYIKLFLQLSRGIIDLAGSHEEAGLKMLYETHAFMVDQKEKGQAISEELLNRTQEELFKALHAGTYKLLATQYGLESRFWQRRPGQATLDLLEALIRVGTNSHKKTAISLADYYLQDAGQIDHWRDQVLLAKARARIGLEELEDASAILQSLNSNSVDVRLLHIQTLTNIKEQIPLLEQMAVDFPENPTIIASLIQYYFNQGRSDSVLYDRARALLTQALKTDPDNFTYRRMMTILNEPGTLPHMIEAKRFFDIEIEVRQAIKDPLKRFRTLGVFYTNSAMKAKTDAQALLAKAKTDAAKDKAQSEADRSEALWAKAREAFEKTIKLEPADDQQAYGHLFKIAIATEDWAVAQSLVKKIAGQDATQGLLAEGQLAITRQQWSQAADVLKVYLGKTPISPQGHFDLALCYQNLNQAQNALDEARIAEKQSPGNSRIQILINELQYAVAIQSSKGVARQEEGLKLSNLYMAYGDQAAQKMRTAEAQSEYDKAQKELDRILKEDPEHVEASKAMRQLKIKLGSLALRMADYEKARSYAEAILAVEPDHQLAGLLKCESFFYNGQYELAESMLLSLRKKEPATSTFGQALLAKVYWQMGRKDEGIAQLQVALKSQPNNMGIIRLLDQMLKSSKRWGDLEAMYNGLLSQHPDSINLYYDACRIAWMQDKNDKALEYMRRAWAKDTNPDTLNGLLQALLKVKNYREILSLVDGNLKGNSFDILLLLHKAEATWGLGRDKEALSIFANVLERVQTEPIATKLIVLNSVSRVGAPDSIQAWAGEMIRQKPTSSIMYQVSATIYSLQAKHEQEISALLKALEFSSGSDETAIIYRHLATAYLKTKNYGKCIEYYRLLLKTAPDNVSVLNNLAYALMEQGDQNGEALTIASKAYALSPDNPLIMDTYALSLIHKKEYVQAETISRKVIQEMQRQGQDVPVEFEYRLGQALVGQNRMAEAQKQLKPVLEKLKVAPDSKNNTMWQEKIADLLK